MTQQIYATTWSSLLSTLARPIVLTGLLRDIISQQFQPGILDDPRLADLIWKNSPDTKLVVESSHRWAPQLTEHRPAVIIKRNAYSNVRMGIADRLQGEIDLTGDEHFSTFWSGSHTLFCLGGTGAQAEVLGTEVQKQLTEFASVIERYTALKRFLVLSVDAVGELEEAVENFVVPVTVGYVYEENWVLSANAPTLSKISLSTILDF